MGIELIVAALGGAVIVWLLIARSGSAGDSASSGITSGDVCTAPTSLQGVSIQTLSSSGTPSGSQPSRTTPLPPKPQTPTTYDQKRTRPDGPMYIYPVSTAGMHTVTSQVKRPTAGRVSFNQP